MKCQKCDCILTDYEAIKKCPITKQYLDICLNCLHHVCDDCDQQVEVQTISLDEMLERLDYLADNKEE